MGILQLPRGKLIDQEGKALLDLQEWMSATFYAVSGWQQAGPTAQRPITRLTIGQQFFDTTLGHPVWIKTVKPIVWVNSQGNPV